MRPSVLFYAAELSSWTIRDVQPLAASGWVPSDCYLEHISIDTQGLKRSQYSAFRWRELILSPLSAVMSNYHGSLFGGSRVTCEHTDPRTVDGHDGVQRYIFATFRCEYTKNDGSNTQDGIGFCYDPRLKLNTPVFTKTAPPSYMLAWFCFRRQC
jgi:hypothetical protein